MGTNYVTNLSPMHVPYHLYEFDLKSFELNAKKLGYEIAHFEYFVCNIYKIPFPFFIGALVFVRDRALPAMFTSDELDALDA